MRYKAAGACPQARSPDKFRLGLSRCGSRTGLERLIKFLAKFFRGLHLILGVSVPPEGQNERTFVMIWLGILAFLIAFCAALTYFLPHLYFKK